MIPEDELKEFIYQTEWDYYHNGVRGMCLNCLEWRLLNNNCICFECEK